MAKGRKASDNEAAKIKKQTKNEAGNVSVRQSIPGLKAVMRSLCEEP